MPARPAPPPRGGRDALGAALRALAMNEATAVRVRLAPGERKLQILQTLAQMLEGSERVTTALLAERLQLSEAALYRHFASKAQMFEGLIAFIEDSLFGLATQIGDQALPAPERSRKLVGAVLQFGERNPGMARVMVGDALALEHERLTVRIHHLFERLESSLRQWLREADANTLTPTVDAQAQAAVLMAYAQGRLLRFVRSGFRDRPTEHWDIQARWL
ncbi:MAG: nucleoid occlusion factor SlmA [Inhella sp.]|uniref:nucleoid occlusion factor SlmA n=2 Tax=Inhella sp. TaxID=1921806 RepID=UPI00391FC8B5